MVKDYLLKVKGGSSSLQMFANQPPRKDRRKQSQQVKDNIKLDLPLNLASDETVILAAMRNKRDAVDLAQKDVEEKKVYSSQIITEKQKKMT